MKKYISFVIALALAIMPFGITYADNKTYTLSLDNAIEIALTDNGEIIANEHKITGAKVNVKSAYLSRAPYKNAVVNVSTGFETYCLKEGYYIEAAQMQERLSIKEGEKIKGTIEYNVTKAYYNVVLLNKLINAAQNSYNLALINMNTVTAQYQLGLISALDYENAVISVDAAKNALEASKMNFEIALDNFKVLVGLDDKECEIVLTDEIEYEEFSSDLSLDTETALNSRYDLFALSESMKLSERYWDLSSVLTDSSATYNTAYADYLSSKNTYENALKMTKIAIKSAYNDIVTAKANLDVSKRQYEMKLKRYEAAKIEYELGVISNIELTGAINDLYDAQVSYAQAKLNYKMAVETYKMQISSGL